MLIHISFSAALSVGLYTRSRKYLQEEQVLYSNFSVHTITSKSHGGPKGSFPTLLVHRIQLSSPPSGNVTLLHTSFVLVKIFSVWPDWSASDIKSISFCRLCKRTSAQTGKLSIYLFNLLTHLALRLTLKTPSNLAQVFRKCSFVFTMFWLYSYCYINGYVTICCYIHTVATTKIKQMLPRFKRYNRFRPETDSTNVFFYHFRVSSRG